MADWWEDLWTWAQENAPFLIGGGYEFLKDKPVMGTLPVYSPYVPTTPAPSLTLPSYGGYVPKETVPTLTTPAYNEFSYTGGAAPTLTMPGYTKFSPSTELPEGQTQLIDKIFAPYAQQIQSRATQGAQRAVGAAAARGAYGMGSAAAATNMVQSIAAKENQELIGNKSKAVLAQLDNYNRMLQTEHGQAYQAEVSKAVTEFNAANGSYQFAYQMAYQQNKDKYYAEVDAAYKNYQAAWNNYQDAVTRGEREAIAQYQGELTQAQGEYQSSYNKWAAENNIAQTEHYRKFQADADAILQKYQGELDAYKSQTESVSKILGYLQQNKENSTVQEFLEGLGDAGKKKFIEWFEETTGGSWDEGEDGGGGGGIFGDVVGTIGAGLGWLASLTGIVSFLGVAAPIAGLIYAWVNRPQGEWKNISADELAMKEYLKYIGGGGEYSIIPEIQQLEQERQALIDSGYASSDADLVKEYDRKIAELIKGNYSTQFNPTGQGGRALTEEEQQKFYAKVKEWGLPTELIAPSSDKDKYLGKMKTGAEMLLDKYLTEYNTAFGEGNFTRATMLAGLIRNLGGKVPGGDTGGGSEPQPPEVVPITPRETDEKRTVFIENLKRAYQDALRSGDRSRVDRTRAQLKAYGVIV